MLTKCRLYSQKIKELKFQLIGIETKTNKHAVVTRYEKWSKNKLKVAAHIYIIVNLFFLYKYINIICILTTNNNQNLP